MNIVFGAWKSIEEVANDMWQSLHSVILCGQPLFAYKSIDNNQFQLVIVCDCFLNNLGTVEVKKNSFTVSMIVPGFTELVPHVPLDYLEQIVKKDLIKYKLDKDILKSFDEIILNYNKVYGKN